MATSAIPQQISTYDNDIKQLTSNYSYQYIAPSFNLSNFMSGVTITPVATIGPDDNSENPLSGLMMAIPGKHSAVSCFQNAADYASNMQTDSASELNDSAAFTKTTAEGQNVTVNSTSIDKVKDAGAKSILQNGIEFRIVARASNNAAIPVTISDNSPVFFDSRALLCNPLPASFNSIIAATTTTFLHSDGGNYSTAPLGTAVDGTYIVEWYGKFQANATGNFYFSATSNVNCCVWLGPTADSGYGSSNMLFSNPPKNNKAASAHALRTRGKSFKMDSQTMYSIRIQVSTVANAVFKMQVKSPNGAYIDGADGTNLFGFLYTKAIGGITGSSVAVLDKSNNKPTIDIHSDRYSNLYVYCSTYGVSGNTINATAYVQSLVQFSESNLNSRLSITSTDAFDKMFSAAGASAPSGSILVVTYGTYVAETFSTSNKTINLGQYQNQKFTTSISSPVYVAYSPADQQCYMNPKGNNDAIAKVLANANLYSEYTTVTLWTSPYTVSTGQNGISIVDDNGSFRIMDDNNSYALSLQPSASNLNPNVSGNEPGTHFAYLMLKNSALVRNLPMPVLVLCKVDSQTGNITCSTYDFANEGGNSFLSIYNQYQTFKVTNPNWVYSPQTQFLANNGGGENASNTYCAKITHPPEETENPSYATNYIITPDSKFRLIMMDGNLTLQMSIKGAQSISDYYTGPNKIGSNDWRYPMKDAMQMTLSPDSFGVMQVSTNHLYNRMHFVDDKNKTSYLVNAPDAIGLSTTGSFSQIAVPNSSSFPQNRSGEEKLSNADCKKACANDTNCAGYYTYNAKDSQGKSQAYCQRISQTSDVDYVFSQPRFGSSVPGMSNTHFYQKDKEIIPKANVIGLPHSTTTVGNFTNHYTGQIYNPNLIDGNPSSLNEFTKGFKTMINDTTTLENSINAIPTTVAAAAKEGFMNSGAPPPTYRERFVPMCSVNTPCFKTNTNRTGLQPEAANTMVEGFAGLSDFISMGYGNMNAGLSQAQQLVATAKANDAAIAKKAADISGNYFPQNSSTMDTRYIDGLYNTMTNSAQYATEFDYTQTAGPFDVKPTTRQVAQTDSFDLAVDSNTIWTFVSLGFAVACVILVVLARSNS